VSTRERWRALVEAGRAQGVFIHISLWHEDIPVGWSVDEKTGRIRIRTSTPLEDIDALIEDAHALLEVDRRTLA
jgi:hypothetical protein